MGCYNFTASIIVLEAFDKSSVFAEIEDLT